MVLSPSKKRRLTTPRSVVLFAACLIPGPAFAQSVASPVVTRAPALVFPVGDAAYPQLDNVEPYPGRDALGDPGASAGGWRSAAPSADTGRLLTEGALASDAVAVMLLPDESDGGLHWIADGNASFCHWKDDRYGRDWFGVRTGDSVFWSVYWRDYFWWYDSVAARWVWFWQGNWWWSAPGRQPYLYLEGGYYQWTYEPGGVILKAAAPGGADQAPTYVYSSDGTRLVQIAGARREAALFDLSRRGPDGGFALIRYLGAGASRARFTAAADGSLRLVLESRRLFETARVVLDGDGDPVDAGAAPRPLPPAPGAEETADSAAPQGAPGVYLPPSLPSEGAQEGGD